MMNYYGNNVYTIRDREFGTAEKRQKEDRAYATMCCISNGGYNAIVELAYQLNERNKGYRSRSNEHARFNGIVKALSVVYSVDCSTIRMILVDVQRTLRKCTNACEKAGHCYPFPQITAYRTVMDRNYKLILDSLMR